MNKIRVACGITVALEPVLDVSNMYTTTFSEFVRLYDYTYSLGALPRSRKTLYVGRKVTLRLALRRVNEMGAEEPVDLTGLTPRLLLHQQQRYDQVGDPVFMVDFSLVVETPAAQGMCYIEMGVGDIPAKGEYIAEVAFFDPPDYATFASFTLSVEQPEL